MYIELVLSAAKPVCRFWREADGIHYAIVGNRETSELKVFKEK
jgi:hypothetical protein